MARKSKTYQPRPKLSREQLSVIFRNHDGDGDGRLSTTELTAAFRYIGAFLPSYRALHALLHTDSDGDGFIGEKDFELLVNYAEKRKYTDALWSSQLLGNAVARAAERALPPPIRAHLMQIQKPFVGFFIFYELSQSRSYTSSSSSSSSSSLDFFDGSVRVQRVIVD
ncbi:Polcalcin Bet v 4, partial [Cucurbita argyrosperma subsp. sororia]